MTVWSDYLCPWCYLATERAARLREWGCVVVNRPFELHPDIPAAGRRVDPRRYERVAAELAAAGLPFRAPVRVPNTRRALETAEWVRQHTPGAFPAVEAGLFRAQFVDGRAIDDPDVIDAILRTAGVDPAPVRSLADQGALRAAVDTSMGEALELGVAGVPTWRFGDAEFVLPGAQPAETMARILHRLRTNTAT